MSVCGFMALSDGGVDSVVHSTVVPFCLGIVFSELKQLACVASLPNRVIARKLEREQKKKFLLSPPPHPSFLFFALVPTFLDELARKRLLRRLLSNENADVSDVMNSNRKFVASLDGTLLSHTTNLNAFALTPAVRICRGSEQ